jgi:uncharacterized membrane-anchored protein
MSMDWNTAGAIASCLQAAIAILAAGYGYVQYRAWKLDRETQISILVPAFHRDLKTCILDLRKGAADLRASVKVESLSELAARGRTLQVPIGVLDRMLDRFELFGRENGSRLSKATAEIIRVNSALDGFARMKTVNGKLEAIADRAIEISDRMERAEKYAQDALDAMKRLSMERVGGLVD